MNILNKRRIKHSSVSAVFTAVVILLVMLVNAVFSLLASKYSLYFDLTSSALWTLSDTAKEAISKAEGDITITFCSDRDYIEENEYMQYISNTANEISKEFSNVHVRYINSKLDPHRLKAYKNTTNSSIRETDVIVEKGDATLRADGEKPGEFRKLAAEAFYVEDSGTGELWAYNGEEIFAAACLAVTADEMPKALFTTGHGEAVALSDISHFMNVITMAGYEVGFIDLATEEIPEDCRLLIVNDPKRDFIGYDPSGNVDASASEIKKIDAFLEENRTLMVFKSPDSDYLRNLEEFLYTWGIVFGEGTVYDSASSLDMAGTTVMAQYAEEGTIASSLAKELRNSAAPPKTIFDTSRPIYVADSYTAAMNEEGVATNTYEYYGNNAYREMSTVYFSTGSATVKQNGETVDSEGGYSLMTITRELNYKNSDTYYGYVMAAGTKNFTAEDYINSNTYGNEDIIYYALRMMGREKVPADIDFKVFATTEIENMTSSQAIRTAVMLITVLPVFFAIVGVVVTTRRKFR